MPELVPTMKDAGLALVGLAVADGKSGVAVGLAVRVGLGVRLKVGDEVGLAVGVGAPCNIRSSRPGDAGASTGRHARRTAAAARVLSMAR